MKAVVETLDQLIQAQGAKAHRCELDRQWDAVQAPRQFDHGGLVGRRHIEGCTRLSRALEQQSDRLRLSYPVRRKGPITVRQQERADLDDGLACDPEGLP